MSTTESYTPENAAITVSYVHYVVCLDAVGVYVV
jgi:hypothetical protein